jgi:hypothetical protein
MWCNFTFTINSYLDPEKLGGRGGTESTETLQRFKFLKVLNGIMITAVYHLTNITEFSIQEGWYSNEERESKNG